MNQTVELLRQHDKGLVQAMLSHKYYAMSKSPYHFFRGSVPLFYHDLNELSDFPSSPFAWICGDLHSENAGAFADEAGKTRFDLNDFDEAALAPVLWELARFCCSILCAAETNGLSDELANDLITAATDAWSLSIRTGKNDPRLHDGGDEIKKIIAIAENKSPSRLLEKRTEDKKRLSRHKKHHVIQEEHKRLLIAHIQSWLIETSPWPKFEVLDICFRRAGLGSLGQQRYLVLCRDKEETILLDFKQSRRSSLLSFAPDQPKWQSDSERIILVQTASQKNSPVLVNFRQGENHFVVHEFRAHKKNLCFSRLVHNYSGLKDALNHVADLSAACQKRSADLHGLSAGSALEKFVAGNAWKHPFITACKTLHKKQMSRYEEFRHDFTDLLPLPATL